MTILFWFEGQWSGGMGISEIARKRRWGVGVSLTSVDFWAHESQPEK